MLKIYNTFTNKKEEFKSINAGKVGMYTCGPTVYDYIHIGNIRSYTTPDILRRYLLYLGYEVKHIKNITDVGHLTEDDIVQGDSGEDKLVKKSLKEKKSPEEIANFYEEYFKETEKEMNILPANYFPRATAHIPQMIKIIESLIEKGFAYEKNGNVFFNICKFSEYGKLSGNTLENLNVCKRFDGEEHEDKKNQWDFALWLKAPKNHLMQWQSPWSVGYPGWHIECSAMSTEYLGEQIDFHTGGEDNIFPHHEAEIAQTECHTGKKWVNYWIHTRYLLVDSEKMAKSKGNFYKFEDVKEKGFSAMDLRMLILSSHYRSQMNFSWESLTQAQKNRKTLENFFARITNSAIHNFNNQQNKRSKIDIKKFQEQFENAMNDDLNTPLVLSVIFDFVKNVNSVLDKNENTNLTEVKSFFEKSLNVLGIVLEIKSLKLPKEIVDLNKENEFIDLKNILGTVLLGISQEIIDLMKQRNQARDEKDFKKSDQLRDEIKKLGFEIKDVKDGYELVKL
ncbi:MAG: cysteine--tRNA ligase [Candidatus Moranbacteria bacterium]|nr:cysteine--tRNA ligase [Candidatus Moranbacteria bacterium]